jgi:hypothetical protein
MEEKEAEKKEEEEGKGDLRHELIQWIQKKGVGEDRAKDTVRRTGNFRHFGI